MMERSIEIPNGVNVDIEGLNVVVRGPKGQIQRDFSDPRYFRLISIEKAENNLVIKAESNKRKLKSVIGTIAAHIKNMMTGVLKNYKYTMKIHYTHFPINVETKGNKFYVRNFLGEKGSRVASIADNVKVTVQKDSVTLIGVNKEDLGKTAANIERACRMSRKDRRIFLDGIYLEERGVAE